MNQSLFSYKGIIQVLVSLAVLTLIQAIMIIYQAYYLAESISSLFGGDLFLHVLKKLLIFFLALIIRHLITFFKNRITHRFAARTSVALRHSVLEKLFQLGPRFVRKEGSGQAITLIMEGIIKFQQYLELFIPKLVNVLIIPASLCLFLFFQNVRSAIILIIAVPILIVFMIILGLAAKDKANRQYASYQLLSNHFVDSLRGIETLKYLGQSRQHVKKISLVSEQYRKATMATLRIAFLSTFALDFFTMLSIAMVAVFLGLGLIHGTIVLNVALVVLILAPEYFLPIREIGADYHATLDGREAESKIQDILQEKMEMKQEISLSKWSSHHTFEARCLRVKHQDSPNGLESINFSIKGMKKVGIVGLSGAGKSTLVDALSGFLTPTEGEFVINGEPLPHLNLQGWQSQLTYIPQHPYIFSDTIENNIRFYQPDANDEEVLMAAKQSGLLPLIESLPDQIKTMVGEGGRPLSGGQEQRIAIARAFLGGRSILILDEPTAHLDIETEYDIKETLLELFKGKLVFFATHRYHWMLEMDQILVLNKGKRVEWGTHEQLVAKKDLYYQLITGEVEDHYEKE